MSVQQVGEKRIIYYSKKSESALNGGERNRNKTKWKGNACFELRKWNLK